MRCTLHPRAPKALTSLFTRVLGLILALTFSVAALAQATDTGTGSITGRVLNVTNGQFLPRAVVRVEGVTGSTLTNDFGEFTVRNVPAGERVVTASFTGMEPRSVNVAVPVGAAATAQISLGSSADVAKLAEGDKTIMLDPFTVETNRFATAQQIAINEERYSVNIKNVVAADAFGDIAQGNVGEFVKFLPGVEVDYGGTYTSPADASGISIRGFGAADTIIYVDGMPISSASPASLSNAVGLDMMSINNASRVEIIKVATPDMPANSIGGQINLISKSAFESAKPSFSIRTYMTLNSENPELFKKVPGPKKKPVYGSLPGFDFSYTHPFSKSFGISLTGAHYEEFTANRRFQPTWVTANVNADLRAYGLTNASPVTNATGAASLANPFLERVALTDSPRWQRRNSASLKADWKPIAGLTLTGSYQVSVYDSADAARRIQFRVQRPQAWSASETVSLPYYTAPQSVAAGLANFAVDPGNSLQMDVDSRDKSGITHTGYFKAKFQKGPWDIEASASASTSRGSYHDLSNGHFSKVELQTTVGRIDFLNIADGIPSTINVYRRDGTALDYTDLANWTLNNFKAYSGKAESLSDVFTYKADVRRELDFLPFSWVKLAFKTGVLRTEKLDKKWGFGTGYRESYYGGTPAVSTYLDTSYIGQQPGWGYPAQQWPSTYLLYDYYVANPTLFNTSSDEDRRENYTSYVNQNKRIKEVEDAYYAMFDGKALSDRLAFNLGLRQSKATRTGAGPQTDSKWNYLKNADGTLYRNTALLSGTATVRIDQANSPLFLSTSPTLLPGATQAALLADLAAKGISYPTSVVANNTYAMKVIQLQPLREVYGESKGKPSYMAAFSYDITKNLVGKLSWSRSFGRISLEDSTAGILSGNGAFTINENETAGSVPQGTIAVANPNLKPWTSDNWDFGLTYYTDSGGKVGLSYFTKNVTNFQETITTPSTDPAFPVILDALGLDPASYDDWQVTTSFNGQGVAKTDGWEFEIAQDLRFVPYIGDWGQRFYVFGNYTMKRRKVTNSLLSARPAADDTASLGLQFATNRFSAMIKGTWTDLKLISSSSITYNGVSYPLGTYAPALWKFDANASYQLTKRFSLFASARDIFNAGDERRRYELNSSLYPSYASLGDLREFGVNITFGVRAQF